MCSLPCSRVPACDWEVCRAQKNSTATFAAVLCAFFGRSFPLAFLERIRIEIVSNFHADAPLTLRKSVVFPCVRLRVVALGLPEQSTFSMWNCSSLKRVAFQTIRPVVSRKKRGFPAWFWPGVAFHLFSQVKRSMGEVSR